MSRTFALLMTVIMGGAALGAAHIKDGMDDLPVVIILAHEGPSIYDLDASDEADYPEAIPVRLVRGNSQEKPVKVLKASIGAMTPESAHQRYALVSAPSQQSLYHRQPILRL